MSDQMRSKSASSLKGQDRTGELEPMLGTCAFLEVVSVIDSGAFLACGLGKDLFVPNGEQQEPMIEGESYCVCIYRNEKTGFIAGSSRLNKRLYDEAPAGLREGDGVDLLIYMQTDMGYKAAINGDCWGLIYQNEIFQTLCPGQRLKGYVKKIREDGRIDLALHKPGYDSVPDLSEKILSYLKSSGGSSPITDKTPPEEIYRLFGVSKKKFKMAVGNLFKQRKLDILKTGISLMV